MSGTASCPIRIRCTRCSHFQFCFGTGLGAMQKTANKLRQARPNRTRTRTESRKMKRTHSINDLGSAKDTHRKIIRDIIGKPPSSLVFPKRVVGCRGGSRDFEGDSTIYHSFSRYRRFKKMIFRKYKDSTPIPTYSKIFNSLSKACMIQ